MTADPILRRLARHTIKPVLYGAIDSIFRAGIPRRINGEIVRLSMQASRFYPSHYEPDKAAFLRRYCRPGSTAIDVGAHVGVFTVLMARAVGPSGRVVAFEPSPLTRLLLEKTVSNNNCRDIIDVRKDAVSAATNQQVFYASKFAGDMGNTIANPRNDATPISVSTVTIDSIAREEMAIDCIKIDAEGAEIDILRGAASTLRRLSPAMTIEVHPRLMSESGYPAEELWDLLTDFGYQVLRNGCVLSKDAFLSESESFEIEALPTTHRARPVTIDRSYA